LRKSVADLKAENKYLRRSNGAQGLAATAQTLIRWIGLAFIAFMVKETAVEIAGTETIADVGVKFLADIRVSESVAWITAFLFGGYGAIQRKLRKDVIQQMSGRMTNLETTIDPKRSSSRLTERGDTNPGDRI
jgi:hypothetical protein